MRRDMQIVEKILSALEARPAGGADIAPLWDRDPGNVHQAHLLMLEQGGFVARLATDDDQWQTADLTWTGHELLDSIRQHQAA